MSKKQKTSSSSFSLFSNPNPLIRSFNIPEPIIHPPGTDPYAFSNPKPHDDDKLKPMAPFDVDPCAASRTEIVTKTTDLTASEHAGVTFAEPPMALMASDSLAHSETSAPQIVNDVAETKIGSKNSQILHCFVCNAICNSEEVFKEHKEGKKHLKNLQKLSVSSPIIQETPLPVTDAASNHESEKKKQDFFENSPSVKSLFACNIPDVVCKDRNINTEHPHIKKQETQVNNCPLNTSISVTLVQSSNSSTEKVEDDLNCNQRKWCEVCKVTCYSQQNLLQHNLGKKHLKNLKDSEKIQTPPLTTPSASMAATPVSNTVEKVGDSEEDCKVICGSSKCFRKHVKGKNHKMNIQETGKITSLPLTRIDTVIIQTDDPVENPKLTKGEVVNPNNGSSKRCEVCGICCRSYSELTMHLSGKKHKKALQKAEKVNGHGVDHVAEKMNEEGKVVILEMGKRKANGSLVSEEDADVKRKKMTGSGALISCRVCNVACTSVVAFQDHLAGQEHSAMVMKQVKA